MAQTTRGLRGLLSAPALYDLLQSSVGAGKARAAMVRDYFPDTAGKRVLDVGCGTAAILAHLPEETRYTGFDAWEPYVAEARRRFGERGTFRVGLVEQAQLESLGRFDLVIAFGLLHHLDDTAARSLFALAARALEPGGGLITLDPARVPGQSPLARWVIGQDRGRNVRAPEAYLDLARSGFEDVRGQVRHDLLRIPYSHVILDCRRPRP